MSTYTPDKWMFLEIKNPDGVYYKVFGTWSGGYLDGGNWRINSGVIKVKIDEDTYTFYGESGSEYIVHKNMYGVVGRYIELPYQLARLKQIRVLSEEEAIEIIKDLKKVKNERD